MTTFFTVAYIAVVNPAILSAEGTVYTLAGRGREVGAVRYALAAVSVGLLLLERFA